MDDSVEILRRAAEGTLPNEITEKSDPPFDLVQELVEAGLLKAIDTSTLDGDSLFQPKITFAGRQFLKEHDDNVESQTTSENDRMHRRGIEIAGDVLRTERKKQTLTQADLARLADLSMLTVSKAERGAMVDAGTIKRLAEALKVDVESLRPTNVDEEIAYQTVLISYGGPDERFARLLYEQLTADGVEVFFFPESAIPGDKLHRTMSEGVRDYDRVLLICSKDSLVRPGVLNEIEQVLIREASEGGSDIFIPINIDSFIYDGWQPEKEDVAQQIRARVVLSFQGATALGPEFSARYARLLTAIEVT